MHLLDKPTPLGIFPTLNSLEEVVELAKSQLPINHQNQIVAILCTYHNTLLKVIGQA